MKAQLRDLPIADPNGILELLGDAQTNIELDGFSLCSEWAPSKIGFLNKKTYLKGMSEEDIHVGILICEESLKSDSFSLEKLERSGVRAVFWCENPRLSFAKIASIFTKKENKSEIHPTSYVHPTVKYGENVSIGPNCSIGENVEIGKNSVICSNVVISANVRIGERTTVYQGATIGSDGFGFEKDACGAWIRIPHLGSVEIGNDVEIGANCTIDKGVFGATRVGNGTKLDNLCHIAHNCQVGENCLIIAGAILSGSIVVEDDCWISPNATLHQKVRVGKGAQVGIGSVVLRGVKDGKTVFGNPAKAVFQRK